MNDKKVFRPVHVNKLIVVLLILVGLTACQSSSRLKIDYQAAKTGTSLEVPPDLDKLPSDTSESGADTYSAYTAEKATSTSKTGDLLPRFKDVEIRTEGDVRWLRVKANKNDLWIDVKNFLGDVGLTIETDNRATGVVETGWAENRAALGSGGGFVSRIFRRFETTGTMDRYRVRLESDASGWMSIYLSHQGMVEKVTETGGDSVRQTVWQRRPSDPELEAEMMRLLMVYLGVENKRAEMLLASGIRRARATLETDPATGTRFISMRTNYGQSQRRLEITLDRLGATRVPSETDGNTTVISYLLPKDEALNKGGFFSRLLSGGKKKPGEYRIQLIDKGATTELRLVNKKRGTDDTSRAADLLQILFDRLK
jgi:outer membrane protein assembly factor BamC